MTTGDHSQVILAGGLTAASVYWVLASGITVGTYSTFSGIILTYTEVVLQTGTSYTGEIFFFSFFLWKLNFISFRTNLCWDSGHA